jgi:hypothetical protein
VLPISNCCMSFLYEHTVYVLRSLKTCCILDSLRTNHKCLFQRFAVYYVTVQAILWFSSYISGVHEFTPIFFTEFWSTCSSIVNFLCRHCLFFCPFSFVHCIVCHSSTYIFRLPLYYLQTFLPFVELLSSYII